MDLHNLCLVDYFQVKKKHILKSTFTYLNLEICLNIRGNVPQSFTHFLGRTQFSCVIKPFSNGKTNSLRILLSFKHTQCIKRHFYYIILHFIATFTFLELDIQLFSWPFTYVLLSHCNRLKTYMKPLSDVWPKSLPSTI